MKTRLFPLLATLPFLCSLASADVTISVLHANPTATVRDIWQAAAQKFESDHHGFKVRFDYLENEAFKAKLPTLLQSRDRPSIFFSWGGGVMDAQIESGICQDITDAVAGPFRDSFFPVAVQNFEFHGRSYGLPNNVEPIVFWYNKDLCKKAGIDPTTVKTWDDFLKAVKTVKAAGLTPIAAGGADKWPLHFYPVCLLMRILGKDGMAACVRGTNGGFTSPDAVKAWSLYKDLCDFHPFQNGYQAAKYDDSAGYFHDGKAVFHLMGTWDLTEGRAQSVTKKGLSNEQLGWLAFPEVAGGKGSTQDWFANLVGWLVTKDQPKETIDFMKIWLGRDTQTKLAEAGVFIPVVKGTVSALQDPFLREIAEHIQQAGWIEIPMDQLLGPDTGRVFNDQAAAVAAGATTPQDAAKAIEDSWAQNRAGS
jgi:raffinose/stachyose/melibiose transport system substrate-binding protein